MFIKLRESNKLDEIRKKHSVEIKLEAQGITISGISAVTDLALLDVKSYLGNIKTVESSKKFTKSQFKLLDKRKLTELYKKYPNVFIYIEEKKEILKQPKG